MSSDGWSPGKKYATYLSSIRSLLTDEQRTVREIYYALEARGFEKELVEASYNHQLKRHQRDPEKWAHPENAPASEWAWEFEYKYVKRAVKKGRRHGYIDPDVIVDTSRPVVADARESHPEPEQFMRNNEQHIKYGYYENFWEDQRCYVEVWLEKAALSSVLQPICDEYNVRLEATRGDWSDSKVYEACVRLNERLDDGKDVRILYLGDYNPSGLHAPVSVQETMGHYGLPLPNRDPSVTYDDETKEMFYFDIWPYTDAFTWSDGKGSIMFERVAINLGQIKMFDLPENPTPSKTDKDRKLRERFMQYESEGRDLNIELDALKEFQRNYLERKVTEAIQQYINEKVREETEARIDRRQAVLREAMGEVDYEVFADDG